MSKPKKCWSQSAGVRGSKVRVAELTPGGVLYLVWVDHLGKQRKKSLGHRDRKRGKEEALAVANRLASHHETLDSNRLTLGRLVDVFLKEGLYGRSDRHRKEAKRKLMLIRNFFSPTRPVDTLSSSDIDRFVEARLAGRVKPAGCSRTRVGRTTAWHDIVALKTAINWATRYRDEHGRRS